MLQVNFKPVVSSESLINSIVINDSAYSDSSVVYMDKALAPRKHELVWVTISDPVDGYMLKRWMYVEQVLYFDYVDPLERDITGQVLLDGEGNAIRKSLREQPGVVKIVLKEHKHALMLSKAQDYYNIPNLLRYTIPNHANLYEEYDLNRLLWPDLEEFLSEYNIALIASEDERPPIVPVNLYWRGLMLADCLDDLLINFSSRVVEQSIITPANDFFETSNFRDQEFVEGLPTLSNLIWKRRRFFDLPNNIKYDTLLYPEESQEYRQQQIESLDIRFSVVNNTRDFQSPSNAFSSSTVIPPFRNVIYCDKAINGADYTELREYLRQSHINKFMYYGFTTKRLPESFLMDYDWSKIEYVFADTYNIKVEHHPREQPRKLYTPPIVRSETYRGRIESMTASTIVLKDIVNLSEPNKNIYLRPLVELPFQGLDYSNIGKDLTFKVENNTMSVVSTSSLFSPISDSDGVLPLFDGSEVDSITHTIEYLNYACTDAAIAFGSDTIYDYEFDSYEINSLAGVNENSFTYDIEVQPSQYWFFVRPEYQYWAKVRFRLKATLSEIIQYLTDSIFFSPMGTEYINASANYWYNNFRFVDLYLTFTPGPTRIKWIFSSQKPTNTQTQPVAGSFSPFGSWGRFIPYISPDVNSNWFSGPDDFVPPESAAFPYSFPLPDRPVTAVANLVPFYGKVGLNYSALVEELALRYIRNHLETFPALISLGFAP